jgi:hypothetical protein
MSPSPSGLAFATVMFVVVVASCAGSPNREAVGSAALAEMNDESGEPTLEDARVVLWDDRDGTSRVLFLGVSSADATPLIALAVFPVGEPERLIAWRMAQVDSAAPASVAFYGDGARSWVFGLVADPEIVELQIDYRVAGARRVPVAPPGFIATIDIRPPDWPRLWTFLAAHNRARLTPGLDDPLRIP